MWVRRTTTSPVFVKPNRDLVQNKMFPTNRTQVALPKNGQAIGQRFWVLFQERGSGMSKVVMEVEAVLLWQEKRKPTRGGKAKKTGAVDSSSSAAAASSSSRSSSCGESNDCDDTEVPKRTTQIGTEQDTKQDTKQTQGQHKDINKDLDTA